MKHLYLRTYYKENLWINYWQLVTWTTGWVPRVLQNLTVSDFQDCFEETKRRANSSIWDLMGCVWNTRGNGTDYNKYACLSLPPQKNILFQYDLALIIGYFIYCLFAISYVILSLNLVQNSLKKKTNLSISFSPPCSVSL